MEIKERTNLLLAGIIIGVVSSLCVFTILISLTSSNVETTLSDEDLIASGNIQLPNGWTYYDDWSVSTIDEVIIFETDDGNYTIYLLTDDAIINGLDYHNIFSKGEMLAYTHNQVLNKYSWSMKIHDP